MGNIRGGMNGFLGTIGQPTAQVIDGSLKFDSASSQYLSSTSTFQNTKSYEMTFSFWLKRCAPTSMKETQYIYSSNVEGTMFFDNGHSDQIGFNLRGSSGSNFFTYTEAKLRDYNAWYHVVVALNLGSGTQSQRFKCYINNVEQTMTNTSYPSNAYHTGGTWYIGAYQGGPSHFPDYYLSNFYCISGQTLDPSYFGFTDPQTNTWRPKKYTGTFTFDNSFYLPLDNEDDFGKDKSGEGNHFTQNNFSGTSIDPDVVKDSPSGAVFGGRGQTGITTTSSAPANYAVLNPLNLHNSNNSFSEGNLKFTTSGSDGGLQESTLAMSSGKFYFEVVYSRSGTGQFAGIRKPGARNYNDSYIYVGTALKYIDGGSGTSYGDSLAHGDIIGTAFDATNGTLEFFKNGVSQGVAYTGISGTYCFFVGSFGGAPTGVANFGQKPFKYAPPQGFLPLNSATVRPNKVVPRSDQYVGVTTYSGDNSEYRLLSFNHQPDLTWFKERGNTRSHILSDTVTGITKHLSTENTDAQTSPSYPYVSSVDERGIVLRGGTSSGGNVSGRYYVAWTWKAGGSKGTFNVDDEGFATAAAAGLGASGNSWDSDPTGASIGTKQGFSIIKHTGTGSTGTLPHGLTQKPTFYISKPVSTSGNWVVYTDVIDGSLDYFYLNTNGAKGDSGQSLPTSELFSYGYTANEYIHYLWHDVPGLQKFGSYTGGGSTYPFIELGFRPALIWIKDTSTSGNHYDWHIFDSTRNPINLGNDNADSKNVLFANLDSQENKGSNPWAQCDFLSNGFRMNDASVTLNNSGSTYIYCAWAEAPASNLFGGQSTAF